jgi:hypothetical protein
MAEVGTAGAGVVWVVVSGGGFGADDAGGVEATALDVTAVPQAESKKHNSSRQSMSAQRR